ncbi:MAG TPA: hypothetical protein VHY37_13900 [Tepidisphaeraceae bacterium]|jgi:hypothetical protein|nr:hypothetical protein [Tepidisphaeraceae bacterium]
MLTSTAVPAASELLCARCGYVLSGLPGDSRCPECGTLISESDPGLRGLPEWERQPGSPLAFVRTTAAVLFQPTHFFRTFATRADRRASQWFAAIQWLAASILFAFAAEEHLYWTQISVGAWRPAVLPAVAVAAFVALAATNWVASWLTYWEATYRGLRLPRSAVHRAMDYHAAHYLPVAAIAAITVGTFTTLHNSGKLPDRYELAYFYVLSGEVIVAAAYLFMTYWIAMRNIMYANA